VAEVPLDLNAPLREQTLHRLRDGGSATGGRLERAASARAGTPVRGEPQVDAGLGGDAAEQGDVDGMEALGAEHDDVLAGVAKRDD